MPALPAPVMQATGVAATWWEPIDGQFTIRGRTTQVRVGLWLDEAAYAAGYQPLQTASLAFSGDDADAALGGQMDLTGPLLALIASRAPFAAPADDP